jgi:hypothetical protein
VIAALKSPFLVLGKALRAQLLLVEGKLEPDYGNGVLVLLDVLDEALADLLVLLQRHPHVNDLALLQRSQLLYRYLSTTFERGMGEA